MIWVRNTKPEHRSFAYRPPHQSIGADAQPDCGRKQNDEIKCSRFGGTFFVGLRKAGFMVVKILSIREHPSLTECANTYCRKSWSVASDYFARVLKESLCAENGLPATWLMFHGETLIGFYQLSAKEGVLEDTGGRTPWITTLFVDASRRGGWGFGELLLTHARYEAGALGYDKVYLTTDHIGYYERYGFLEIGLARFSWGRPTKLYAADALFADKNAVRYQLFDAASPLDDETRLRIAALNGHDTGGNPAVLLHFMKKLCPSALAEARGFTVTALCGEQVVGAVRLVPDEDHPLRWLLSDLRVASDFRRRGIACTLVGRGLDALRRKASGGECVCACVERENTASAALFIKLGFVKTNAPVQFTGLDFPEDAALFRMEL
ncbi:MAG: GNAT family N-acetyltransferase [Oscillospiraceae bacterium]